MEQTLDVSDRRIDQFNAFIIAVLKTYTQHKKVMAPSNGKGTIHIQNRELKIQRIEQAQRTVHTHTQTYSTITPRSGGVELDEEPLTLCFIARSLTFGFSSPGKEDLALAALAGSREGPATGMACILNEEGQGGMMKNFIRLIQPCSHFLFILGELVEIQEHEAADGWSKFSCKGSRQRSLRICTYCMRRRAMVFP